MRYHDLSRSINERVLLGAKYSSAEFISCLKAAGAKYPAPLSRELYKVCSYITVSSIGPRNVIVRTGAITKEVVERAMTRVKASIKHQAMDEGKAIELLKARGYIIYKPV